MMILGVNEKPTVRPYAYLAYIDAILENKILLRGMIRNAQGREWSSISYDTDVCWDGDCVNIINHDTYDGNNNTETFIYTVINKEDEVVVRLEQFVNIRENAIVNFFVCAGTDHNTILSTLEQGYRLGITRFGLYIKHKDNVIDIDARDLREYIGEWNKVKWIKLTIADGKIASYLSLDGNKWYKIDEMETLQTEQYKIMGINTNFLGLGEQYYNWLYMNFVQLHFSKEEISQVYLNYYNCPYIGMVNEQSLAPLFLETRKDNVEDVAYLFSGVNDYLFFWLMRSYYVVISIDEYYVPGHGRFQKEHFYHPVLVYGFDEKTKEFIVLDYDMKLFTARVSYDVFAQADFFQRDYSIMRYRYISNISAAKMEFNVNTLTRNLNNFLEGNGENERFVFMLPGQKGTYGIAIWNDLLNDSEVMELFIKDRRLFYVLYEHANLMKQRIFFLRVRGFLHEEDTKEVLITCGKLLQSTEALKNLVIWFKINNTNDRKKERVTERRAQIKELLGSICNLEVQLFKELLEKVR